MRNHLLHGARYSGNQGNDGQEAERLGAIRNEKMVVRFVNTYLRHDGVFLLRLIAHNTNGITTTEITHELWDLWYDDQQPIQTHPKDGAENELIPFRED